MPDFFNGFHVGKYASPMDAMGKGFTWFLHFEGLDTSEKFWVLLHQRQAQALSLMISIFHVTHGDWANL